MQLEARLEEADLYDFCHGKSSARYYRADELLAAIAIPRSAKWSSTCLQTGISCLYNELLS